ncbi:flagellar basal body rod protein FlgC [Pisciglobus halotolerans]|uniref:Flagellar basal-body rod protein FlgC n=1 Tax=Pisciglobus halotolerans TaxID=745365 RepID=A0A1I3AN83_9LACT|nr:flagellar basal body rod protein FlgC [Pisciglobus halotolerans]SFH51527.1 flagellar basal-body rod protein FlgC [Pisciglobus halotolerans]
MSVFDSMRINGSGLTLERLKLDTISTNVANVNTTRTAEGGPYRKKEVTFEENLMSKKNGLGGMEKSFGVKPTGIEESDEILLAYDPLSPDADEDGYVQQSNVNMADEMVEMMNTLRTYEANTTALNASKSILKKALEISAN